MVLLKKWIKYWVCGSIACLLALSGQAQKQDAVWVFGQNAGIDFTDTANPVAFKSSTYSFENTASIADSVGNLLFYLGMNTNIGNPFMAVIDKAFQIVPNGRINTQPYGKNSLIIPVKNSSTYFIFHVGTLPNSVCNTSWCSALYYSVVNIQNGNILIVKKDQLISPVIVEDGLAAIKHQNGKDWWVVYHKRQTPDDTICDNTFYTLLLESDSISEPTAQKIGSQHCDTNIARHGVIQYNANSGRLVYANINKRLVEVYNFDRCSGILKGYQMVDSSFNIHPYSAELSLSGRLLYITSDLNTTSNPTIEEGHLYQYDLEAQDIPASRVEIWNDNNHPNVPGQLQLAPDGKIYMAFSDPYSPILNTDSTMEALSYINQPDSAWVQCDFRPFAFPLADSTYSHMSLPNMPNYNLGPQGVFLATAGDDTVYCPARDTAGTTLGNPPMPHVVYLWQPATGLSNVSAAQPKASPTQSTWYYLTATDTTAATCAVNYDSVYVTVKDCGIGINQNSLNEIRVYPNPVNNQLHISAYPADRQTTTPGGTISLYNLLGGEALTQPLTETHTSLDVSMLQAGVYVYRITQNGRVVYGKVVVE